MLPSYDIKADEAGLGPDDFVSVDTQGSHSYESLYLRCGVASGR